MRSRYIHRTQATFVSSQINTIVHFFPRSLPPPKQSHPSNKCMYIQLSNPHSECTDTSNGWRSLPSGSPAPAGKSRQIDSSSHLSFSSCNKHDCYTDTMDTATTTDSDPESFAISESLAPWRDNRAAVTTRVSLDGLLPEPLLLKEDLKEGCGGQLWPAGMVLAKYIINRHSSDLGDKTMSVSFLFISCFLFFVFFSLWLLCGPLLTPRQR